jgi:hypothetical protein
MIDPTKLKVGDRIREDDHLNYWDVLELDDNRIRLKHFSSTSVHYFNISHIRWSHLFFDDLTIVGNILSKYN